MNINNHIIAFESYVSCHFSKTFTEELKIGEVEATILQTSIIHLETISELARIFWVGLVRRVKPAQDFSVEM
jgi:hypothetical protein